MRVAILGVFTAEEREVLKTVAVSYRIGWPERNKSVQWPEGETSDEEIEVVGRRFRMGQNPEPVTLERIEASLADYERLIAVLETQTSPDLWRSIVGTEPSGMIANPGGTVEFLVCARTEQLRDALEGAAILRRARETILAIVANTPGRVGWPEEEFGDEDPAEPPKGEWYGLAINVDFAELHGTDA